MLNNYKYILFQASKNDSIDHLTELLTIKRHITCDRSQVKKWGTTALDHTFITEQRNDAIAV